MNIILYLLQLIQYQHKQICWLLNFICRYIPLRQWAFDDSNSPKYQKFKVNELPKTIHYEPWDYNDYIPYIQWRYGKTIQPVNRRSECDIDDNCTCPRCNAPKPYLYKISPEQSRFTRTNTLRCPHCLNALVPKKNRKHFIVHKCVNPKCPYYLHNLKPDKGTPKTGRSPKLFLCSSPSVLLSEHCFCVPSRMASIIKMNNITSAIKSRHF